MGACAIDAGRLFRATEQPDSSSTRADKSVCCGTYIRGGLIIYYKFPGNKKRFIINPKQIGLSILFDYHRHLFSSPFQPFPPPRRLYKVLPRLPHHWLYDYYTGREAFCMWRRRRRVNVQPTVLWGSDQTYTQITTHPRRAK